MALIPLSYTTIESAEQVLIEPATNQQYELKFLSAFKASTYKFNLSVQTGNSFVTVMQETITGGGQIVTDEAIIINGGSKLVARCDTAGIDINGTFQVNPYIP